MRTHHLNCATFCPWGGALFDGQSVALTGELVGHCLLVETAAHGLVLIDTGLGLGDVDHPHAPPARIPRFYRGLLNIKFREEQTAVRQIEQLGFRASDVRHIILTHLDFDHAGGLKDFPDAAVHVLEVEFAQANGPKHGYVQNARYRPRQWNGVKDWHLYAGGGEPWFGLDAVRSLDGLPPEILMVPLPGHTLGQAGIAIRRDDGRWLFHAGDAYFYRGEVRSTRRRCTPGLRAYQALMNTRWDLHRANQERVRQLSVERPDEINVICAHDPEEFRHCAAGSPL